MLKNKINFLKIEVMIFHFVLLIFILYQFLSIFFSSIISIVPTQVPTLFLGIGLLLGFRYLVEMIDKPKVNTEVREHSNFTSAFDDMFGGTDAVRELTIVAYTSMTWFEHVRLRNIKVTNVRILLFYETETVFLQESSADYNTYNLENIAQSWNSLKSDGKIKNIEIRTIEMAAPYYYGSINKQKAMFGFLWPRKGISGLEPRESFSVKYESSSEKSYIKHVDSWFNSMWAVASPLP